MSGSSDMVIENDHSIGTNFILSGGTLSQAAKDATVKVLKYVLDHKAYTEGNETQQQVVAKVQELYRTTPQFTYEDLEKTFNTTSYEHLMAYLLIGFMTSDPVDPMHGLMYTYGRAIPLSNSREWMDNYRINNIGYPMDMLVYHKYDTPTTYSIKQEEPLPIDTSVDDIDYARVCHFLVTPLRAIIMNMPFEGDKDTCRRTCDACFSRYVTCYGGAHGCDVFSIPDMSLSIQEITRVLARYPSLHVQYVLNTATYASGRGVHWVALDLSKGNAKLICSQGTPFVSCFNDGDALYKTLVQQGYVLHHNSIIVQKDDYNCGIYAPIALYMLFIYNGDMLAAVRDGIGVNGTHIAGSKRTATSIDMVRKKLINNR